MNIASSIIVLTISVLTSRSHWLLVKLARRHNKGTRVNTESDHSQFLTGLKLVYDG